MSTTNRISAHSQSESQEPSVGDFSSNLGRALFQHRIEAVLLATKTSTGADGVAVSLKDGEGYVCRASVGLAPEVGVVVEPGQGICGRCIAEATAVVEQTLEGEIKSVAAVPVMKDGQAFGFVAGFSLQPNAFPLLALQDLQALAEAIHNEVDPPVAIELEPEPDETEQELLSQFGITATPKPEEAKQDFVDEDDSFLSELVRDVLESAPSNAITNEPNPPADQVLEEIEKPASPSFPPRTTEEVLMQVVDHPRAPVASGVAAAAPAPALAPVATPTKVTIRKSKLEQKSVPQIAHGSEPFTGDHETAAEIGPMVPGFAKLAANPRFRIAAMLIVAAVLISLLAYSMYFRKPPAQEQQKVLASAPTTNTPAPQSEPTTAANVPETKETKKESSRDTRPATQSTAKQPLVVANTSLPTRHETVEEPPPAALASTAKINAPELPTRAPDVVFGGQRSTGAVPARLLNRVDPVLPGIARSMHLSGEVRLEAVVGADGRIRSVRSLSGQNILATAAADAIRKWRYEPAKQNGKNVESTVEVTMRFR